MTIRHTVREGDCLSSIGFQYGFSADTLWNHDSNAELREQRTSPYVLMPGDVVNIPEKVVKQERRKTGAVHRFRRLGVPAKLRLQLVDIERKPRSGVDYIVTIDGLEEMGTTDADGALQVWIPPNAKEGSLELSTGEHYDLGLGRLAPVSSEEGLRARLHNLGFLGNPEGDARALTGAVRAFQSSTQIDITGVIDDSLRDALLAAHGS